MIDEIVKGDAVDLVCSIGEDITGWKIRAEIWDSDDNIVEKANALAGGDALQIEMTDVLNGVFVVHLSTDDTIEFGDSANLEIEVDVVGRRYTVLKDSISFLSKRIDWTTPSKYPPN